MIQKNLFFIYFNNTTLPKYATYIFEIYKKINLNFNCYLLYYKIDDIIYMYNNKLFNNDFDKLLLLSINTIKEFKNNTYIGQFNRDRLNRTITGNFRVKNNPNYYLNMLIDIYKYYIINYYGGIYIDCDTFPNKPFDDKLLSKDFECYNKDGNRDGFFFGKHKHISKENYPDHFGIKLEPGYNRYIITEKEKNDFRECNLKYKEDLNNPFYIKHYFLREWTVINNDIKPFLYQLFE